MDTTLVQDVRHVTAVEGTALTLHCRLNKPVAEATLRGDDEPPLQLVADATDPALYRITMTMTQSRRLTLYLRDDDGRLNKQPPEFILTVTPNRPPSLKLTFPSRDVDASPLEELQLSGQVSDDFGLLRYGLRFLAGDSDEQEIILGTSSAPHEKISAEYLLALEQLHVEPNQLVSYYFFAEDAGPDGTPRQVMSDMFFAEVRHFDEVYRQGQQPPGGENQSPQQQAQGQQNARGQAQELAAQQKELINATWRLVRREDADDLTPEFSDDATLIRDTQASLVPRVQELAEQLDDAQAQQFVESVTQHMGEAAEALTRALEESSLEALSPALKAEQAAYQSLLRLRAREHEVIRNNQPNSQQSQRGASGSSRSQQQLQQLELSNDRNRYETESSAADRQEQAQGEERQILNRLRELAQRQSDLNERLKELQSELEKAETEEEREELRKQLKRLREQQEEVLRDTDELNSQMNEAQNRESMSESREQLQQARENVRRSSEALEQGQVSRAISSGSRAEQELNELRDEFRERTSDRFAEEARDLQRRANELVEAQEEISELLNERPEPTDGEPRSLRDSSPREKLLEGLDQQSQRLQQLLENMKQTIEEAEEPQPLLAQDLYDSYRRASQNRLQERLDETDNSLRRGFVNDARQLENSAREGLQQLRDEIEQATESVLAGEADALRRARDELNELADQLNEEINQADPGQRRAPSDCAGPGGHPGPRRPQDTRATTRKRSTRTSRPAR